MVPIWIAAGRAVVLGSRGWLAGWRWQARHEHVWAQPASRRVGLAGAGHVGQTEYTFPCSGPRNLCSEADMIDRHRNPPRPGDRTPLPQGDQSELLMRGRVHARTHMHASALSRGNRASLVSSSTCMFNTSWIITHGCLKPSCM